MASSTKSRILVICSRTVFSNLANKAESGGRLLDVGRFSDTRRSDTPPNVSPLSALQAGVATFYDAASKELGAIGGGSSACEALDGLAIWQPLQRIRSRLLTPLTSSSQLCREDDVAEFLLFNN